MDRFRGQGLYRLDEPEAALSPQRQLAAFARLHQLTASGSQFLIATHSPILIADPEAAIYSCSKAGIEPVNYSETVHFQVTRDFPTIPPRMLRELLGVWKTRRPIRAIS